jgi:membrane-bound ClpP family serine protease
MSLTIIVVIILIGLLLVSTEIFLVPGSTFVGVIGLVVIGVGVYLGFESHGFTIGAGILVGSGLITGGLTYVGLKRISSSKFTLNDAVDGRVNEFDYSNINIGDEGVTLTALRPEGNAIVKDQKVIVYSKGEYVDAGKNIIVVNIKNNKIFIQPK